VQQLARIAALTIWTACLADHAAAAEGILLSEADRTIYRAAFEKVDARQFESARALADQAVNPLPGKVIEWLDLAREETGADFAQLAKFLNDHPDWPRQRDLLRNAERAMPADISDAQLLAWFEARPPVTVEGALRYAETLKRSKRDEETAKLLRDTWITFNFKRDQEDQFLRQYGSLLRKADHVARLDRLLWKRSARAARRQARRIGSGYVQLAEARLLLAFRRRGVDRAVKRVPGELRDDPGFIYDRARWRRRKGRYKGVVALLDPPMPDAPYPEFWWPLRHWAARTALDKKDYVIAYRLASHHGFEHGLGFAEGEWLAGWIALRFTKDPSQAHEHFARLFNGVSTPISRARGAYWAGEAARGMDDKEKAAFWYQLAANHMSTFYGQLAAKRLGQPLTATLPRQTKLRLAERQEFARRDLVQVVRLMGQLGARNTQKRFLDRLRNLATTASEFALTAELALEQGRPDRALRTAKEARKAGLILPEHLYPLPELPKTDELDRTLLLAVIRQESQFYSKVVSGAGARGLMQLMPATAKRVARKLKIPYRRRKLTEDPTYNVRLGVAYLNQMLDRYDGSRLLALAAYNAGPRRVDRWIKLFGDPRKPGVDAVDWGERIPFNETRNYVQRILEAVPIYDLRIANRQVDLPLDWATAGFPDPH
jgi:soluble lytic murein transglycosylase